MLRRDFFRHAFAAFLACSALVTAAGQARADDVADAKQLVQTVMKEAISDFAGKTMTNAQRVTILHGYIDRYADMEMASHDILGYYWGKATPDQQAQFKKTVVDYALGSWAQQLAAFPADQRIDFTQSETLPNGRVVLHSLASHTGDIAPVDWTIAHSPTGKLVIADVAVEGVSIIRTMHGDFTAIIRANGGQFAPLLDALNKKIASYQN